MASLMLQKLNEDPIYTGAKWNRSKIGTNGPCVYTGAVGIVPFGAAIQALLALISVFALLFQVPNTKENWIFVIEHTFLLHCNYFRNHLEPFRVYHQNGTVPFSLLQPGSKTIVVVVKGGAGNFPTGYDQGDF